MSLNTATGKISGCPGLNGDPTKFAHFSTKFKALIFRLGRGFITALNKQYPYDRMDYDRLHERDVSIVHSAADSALITPTTPQSGSSSASASSATTSTTTASLYKPELQPTRFHRRRHIGESRGKTQDQRTRSQPSTYK